MFREQRQDPTHLFIRIIEGHFPETKAKIALNTLDFPNVSIGDTVTAVHGGFAIQNPDGSFALTENGRIATETKQNRFNGWILLLSALLTLLTLVYSALRPVRQIKRNSPMEKHKRLGHAGVQDRLECQADHALCACHTLSQKKSTQSHHHGPVHVSVGSGADPGVISGGTGRLHQRSGTGRA